jgi:hypothetical protein
LTCGPGRKAGASQRVPLRRGRQGRRGGCRRSAETPGGRRRTASAVARHPRRNRNPSRKAARPTGREREAGNKAERARPPRGKRREARRPAAHGRQQAEPGLTTRMMPARCPRHHGSSSRDQRSKHPAPHAQAAIRATVGSAAMPAPFCMGQSSENAGASIGLPRLKTDFPDKATWRTSKVTGWLADNFDFC